MHLRYLSFDYTGTVEFTFHISTEDAIRKLTEVTHQPTVRELLVGRREEMLIGQVSKNFVNLSRVDRLKGDVFRPHFYGKFSDKGEVSMLSGQFKMQPAWKMLLGVPVLIFVAVGILLIILGVSGAGGDGSTQADYVLGGPAMIVVALGFVLFIKSIFDRDVELISKKITSLGASGPKEL